MLPRPRRLSPRSRSAIIVTGVLAGTASGQDAALPRQLAGASHVIIPQARAFALERHHAGVEIRSVHAQVSILDGTGRAVELYPVSLDHLHGPTHLIDLACIYTMVGDYDDALDLLEQLVVMPAGVHPKILEISPVFAPLRDDPRFRALIEREQ